MLDKRKVAWDVFLLQEYLNLILDISIATSKENMLKSNDSICALVCAMDPILDKLRDCFADDLPVYESEGEDDGDH